MFINNINIQKESRTKYIAEELSKISNKGDFFAISGGMGSGKTTFIRYFIKKASNFSKVTSPTYNLMYPYETETLTIYHMDAWRIKNSNEILSLGITEMFESSIFLVEWAEKIKNIIPSNCLKLSIEISDNNRVLKIQGNNKWKIRLKGLIEN